MNPCYLHACVQDAFLIHVNSIGEKQGCSTGVGNFTSVDANTCRCAAADKGASCQSAHKPYCLPQSQGNKRGQIHTMFSSL